MIQLPGFQDNLKTHINLLTDPNQQPKTQPPKTSLSKWFYLVEIVFVLIACGIYVGIYFIQAGVGYDIISYYYSSGYKIMSSNIVRQTSVSQPQFTTVNVIKTIVLNWVMWKAANVLVILDMLSPLGWGRKLIGVVSFFILMCAADSVTFVMKQEYDYDFAFVALSCIIALVLTSLLYIKQNQKFIKTFLNAIIPYFSYAFLVGFYWVVMPQLNKIVNKNIETVTNTLTFFYIFPIIDTLLILFNWLMQRWVSEDMRLFVSTANNWLMQGYRTGIILLISISQVEFYYQIVFIIFRNMFFNFVIKKSKSDQKNLSMSGWIVAFFVSYILHFLPICGIFNVVVSKYYISYISMSLLSLLPYSPYIGYITSPTLPINIPFSGTIVWYAPLIIWGASTFTQKYHLYTFNWKLIIYNLFGIYLFYIGIISALGINNLSALAPF